jgi:hypothetical protein
MSKISLSGDAAGTGTFTIASPNSNNNRTLTLPDATGTVVVTGGAQTIEFAAGSASAPSVAFTGDTNTGIYSPGADRIGFAEGGVQTGEFDASGNFLFNSGYGSVAVAYGCRAWVNFNGTTNVGGFCTVRASGNVSTVADNGTGDYTINFTNAFSDANYAISAATNTDCFAVTTLTTSSFKLLTFNRRDVFLAEDAATACISVCR